MIDYYRYKVIEVKKSIFLRFFNPISQIITFCEIFYDQFYIFICLFAAFYLLKYAFQHLSQHFTTFSRLTTPIYKLLKGLFNGDIIF